MIRPMQAVRFALLLLLGILFLADVGIHWVYTQVLIWITLGIWACVCFFGILVTFIPMAILVGITAGGAQADWMSDGFLFTAFLVIPTIASIAMSEVFRWRASRNSHADQSE